MGVCVDVHISKLSILYTFALLMYTSIHWHIFMKNEMPPPRHCSVNLFTKSREITLQVLNKSTSETPGANLKMLSNLPIRFKDYVKSFLSNLRHKLKIAKIF
jgi:hypothetical protein